MRSPYYDKTEDYLLISCKGQYDDESGERIDFGIDIEIPGSKEDIRDFKEAYDNRAKHGKYANEPKRSKKLAAFDDAFAKVCSLALDGMPVKNAQVDISETKEMSFSHTLYDLTHMGRESQKYGEDWEKKMEDYSRYCVEIKYIVALPTKAGEYESLPAKLLIPIDAKNKNQIRIMNYTRDCYADRETKKRCKKINDALLKMNKYLYGDKSGAKIYPITDIKVIDKDAYKYEPNKSNYNTDNMINDMCF